MTAPRKAKRQCSPAKSYNVERCDNPVEYVCKFPNESPIYLCADHVGAHRVSHAEMVREIKESDLDA